MKNKSFNKGLETNEKQKQVREGLDRVLKDWSGYSPEKRHKTRDRLPGELAYLPEPDRKDYIASISKKKIINKTILTKKVNDNVELYKETDGGETETKTESKNKAVAKSCIPGTVGLIKEDNRVKYLTLDQGILTTQSYLTLDNVTYEPKQDLPFFYPTPDVFYYFQSDKDEAKLLADVEKFIRKYLELPDESGYLILALWILHTYLIEKFNCTPIIYWYGMFETGKSRAGEVIFNLAYKGEFETSPTEAVVFRSSEYFKPSLILDELKIWGQDGDKEVARLLKSRYKRGLKVARVDLKHSKGENEIKFFDAFGPTVICTDQKMPPEIESRCLLFVMEKNASEAVEDEIDQTKAQELRDRLTAFRARNLNKDLPDPAKMARRRLQEITRPLQQILVFVAPDREEELKEYVKTVREMREVEESLTLQGEVINAIIQTYQDELVGGGRFLVGDVADFINKDRKQKEEIDNRAIGRMIKQLGYQSARTKAGRAYYFDREKTLKLAKRFGLETSPLEPATKADGVVSDVNDVS